MPPNWKMFENEEDEIIRKMNDGEISQAEGKKQLSELRRDLSAIYEEDRYNALRDVDADWGMY